jgi:hypothetical protein
VKVFERPTKGRPAEVLVYKEFVPQHQLEFPEDALVR